jgi:hypothetical protein
VEAEAALVVLQVLVEELLEVEEAEDNNVDLQQIASLFLSFRHLFSFT